MASASKHYQLGVEHRGAIFLAVFQYMLLSNLWVRVKQIVSVVIWVEVRVRIRVSLGLGLGL